MGTQVRSMVPSARAELEGDLQELARQSRIKAELMHCSSSNADSVLLKGQACCVHVARELLGDILDFYDLVVLDADLPNPHEAPSQEHVLTLQLGDRRLQVLTPEARQALESDLRELEYETATRAELACPPTSEVECVVLKGKLDAIEEARDILNELLVFHGLVQQDRVDLGNTTWMAASESRRLQVDTRVFERIVRFHVDVRGESLRRRLRARGSGDVAK